LKNKIILLGILSCFLINIILTGIHGQKSLIAENIENNISLFVGGTGSGNYSSIQEAINDADSGDNVFIYSNIYYDNIIIDKSINITGEDKYSTIIDGNKLDTVLNLSANWVNISNIKIINSKIGDVNHSYAGLNIRNSNHIFIKNIIISDCYFPVNIVNSNNINLQNCNIFDNIGPVNIYNSSFNSIINCNILNNLIDGISFYRSSYNIVSNCNISNVTNGISLRVSSNNTITNNVLYNNSAYGISIVIVQTVDNKTSENNVIYNNNFYDMLISARDGYNNSWDNGIYGNYWDDYEGVDSDNDGIGDTPYTFFGNIDKYPLINPVELDLTEPETAWLYLIILSPNDNATVKGIVDIAGTSYGSADILDVKIRINNGVWQEANGTSNWRFNWDTTELENGEYNLYVMVNSTDGNSKVKSIMVQVDNIADGNKETSDTTGTPGFELVLLILVFLIIIVKLNRKK
jgi:parallel beta-helix repeat protein